MPDGEPNLTCAGGALFGVSRGDLRARFAARALGSRWRKLGTRVDEWSSFRRERRMKREGGELRVWLLVGRESTHASTEQV